MSDEQKQSKLLIDLTETASLFHTDEGVAYASIKVETHTENWALRGGGFRRWLRHQFYSQHGKPPGQQALQDAIAVLEGKAQFESPMQPVYVRVAGHGGRIYIDLCNRNWEVVEIDAEGWRMVTEPPIRFRRSKSMLQILSPVRGGSIDSLREIINIGGDENWVLCASWLVAACRPTGPFPILILQGEQGSAKSTLAKILKRVIDPSVAPVRTPPRGERDLVIGANNSWVVAYDNVSSISAWISDELCRLATGGGFSTRELFSDSDESIFETTRPVILNGIDLLAERPDLADRAVVLHLPRIHDASRRPEQVLYAEVEARLPRITGALFDAVSGALRRLPQIELQDLPRMADFAVWATAAEPFLGFSDGHFQKAYGGNRSETVENTLETDCVAGAIRALMDGRTEPWSGTCGELLKILPVEEATRRTPEWPNSPHTMGNKLRRLTTFLREAGIALTFLGKGAGGRRIVMISGVVRTEGQNNATKAPNAPQAPQNRLPNPPRDLPAPTAPWRSSPGSDEPPPNRPTCMSFVDSATGAPGSIGGDSGVCRQLQSIPTATVHTSDTLLAGEEDREVYEV